MKTHILLIASLAAATSVSAQSVRVTQIDTAALLVRGQIDAYVSFTGPDGDLLSDFDPEEFLASEQAVDGSRSLEILDIRTEAAKETGIDFLLLVDNSGSMYEVFQKGGTRIEHAQQALAVFLESGGRVRRSDRSERIQHLPASISPPGSIKR